MPILNNEKSTGVTFHKIDKGVDTGDIIEFQNEELEEMKRQVALKMGYELVDHRLELFGKKIIK
jgi:Fur family ferric uptake transcriptional regulator